MKISFTMSASWILAATVLSIPSLSHAQDAGTPFAKGVALQAKFGSAKSGANRSSVVGLRAAFATLTATPGVEESSGDLHLKAPLSLRLDGSVAAELSQSAGNKSQTRVDARLGSVGIGNIYRVGAEMNENAGALSYSEFNAIRVGARHTQDPILGAKATGATVDVLSSRIQAAGVGLDGSDEDTGYIVLSGAAAINSVIGSISDTRSASTEKTTGQVGLNLEGCVAAGTFRIGQFGVCAETDHPFVAMGADRKLSSNSVGLTYTRGSVSLIGKTEQRTFKASPSDVRRSRLNTIGAAVAF